MDSLLNYLKKETEFDVRQALQLHDLPWRIQKVKINYYDLDSGKSAMGFVLPKRKITLQGGSPLDKLKAAWGRKLKGKTGEEKPAAAERANFSALVKRKARGNL